MADINALRKYLAASPDMSGMTLDEMRSYLDGIGAKASLPKGCQVEGRVLDHIPAEWIRNGNQGEESAILYLHGGGYTMGSLVSHRGLAAWISEAAGVTALSLAYRLAPEHPFPAAVEDAAAGYRWLISSGFPPERIAIAGDSAGGGLAIAAMLKLRDSGLPLPAAAICISPWADLTCSSDTYREKADTDPVITREDICASAKDYLRDHDPKNPLASPIFADLTGLPPLLIQVGSEEVLLGDSIALDRQARACGVRSTLEIWEEMIHVWHFFAPVLKEGQEAIARIGEFCREKTQY